MIFVVTAIGILGEPSGDTERVMTWLDALDALGDDYQIHALVQGGLPKVSHVTLMSGRTKQILPWEVPSVKNSNIAKIQRLLSALVFGMPVWVANSRSTQLHTFLRETLKADDTLLLLGGAAGQYAISGSHSRTIWDIVNVLGHSAGSEYSGFKGAGLMNAIQKSLSRRFEKKALTHCKKIVVTSEAEARRAESLYSRRPEEVIPSIAPNVSAVEVNTSSNTFVWIGSFKYRANVDGLLYFLDSCHEKMQGNGVKLRLIGSGLSPSLQQRLSHYSSVEIVGFAPRLEDAVDGARGICIPIWKGAGVKIKTLSAMRMGLPIFATSVAMEGIDPLAAVSIQDDPSLLLDRMLIASEGELKIARSVALFVVEQFFSQTNFIAKVRHVIS